MNTDAVEWEDLRRLVGVARVERRFPSLVVLRGVDVGERSLIVDLDVAAWGGVGAHHLFCAQVRIGGANRIEQRAIDQDGMAMTRAADRSDDGRVRAAITLDDGPNG